MIVEEPGTGEQKKLLCQIKRQIAIQNQDKVFAEVMQAAWADFNNEALYRRGVDAIALITGPLASADGYTVHWLTDMAREFPAADFFRRILLERMGPRNRVAKLEVIRFHLTSANGGVSVDDVTLHAFLRDFHILGFDFWNERGVVISLLHSHLSAEGGSLPPRLWSQVVYITSWKNSKGGYFDIDDLPPELLALRELRRVVVQPTKARQAPQPSGFDVSESHTLGLLALSGQWDQRREADTAALARLFGLTAAELVLKVQSLDAAHPGVMAFSEEVWRVKDRKLAWATGAPLLTDTELTRFWGVATAALGENDPAVELDGDDRMLGPFNGMETQHSRTLRRGLAEGLALAGAMSDDLKQCSRAVRGGVYRAVQTLLSGAPWQRWASLDTNLALIAEASPDAFLEAAEAAAGAEAGVVQALFGEEQASGGAQNYMTGMVWALEGLAWDTTTFARTVLLLAQMAAVDPGGRWTNRPGNSLVSILLPWWPQTDATSEDRMVALKAVANEEPAVAFRVASRLLPGKTTTSSPTHRPTHRPVRSPADPRENPGHHQEVTNAADLVVRLGGQDKRRLQSLVSLLVAMPKPAFEAALELLKSRFAEATEEERIKLWEGLRDIARRHRRFRDADWVLPEPAVEQIEAVATLFEPMGAMTKLRLLFSGPESSHFDDDAEGGVTAIERRRADAVRDLLNEGGITRVMSFADDVDLPVDLGIALSAAIDRQDDAKVLGQALRTTSGKVRRMMAPFIHSRVRERGWDWVDTLDLTAFGTDGQVLFFISAPFEPEGWSRVDCAGPSVADGYWKAVVPRAHRLRDADTAMRALVRVGRAFDAIGLAAGLLYMRQTPASGGVVLDALVATDKATLTLEMPDAYAICTVIRALQQDPVVDVARLADAEWRFLRVLDGHNGARPVTLWRQMSSNAELAMSAIRIVYKPKRADWVAPEPAEGVVENAWHLLHGWRVVPGVSDGHLDRALFDAWYSELTALAVESGHEDVTQLVVGRLLAHAPADPEGFWLDLHLARLLEQRDHSVMREALTNEYFNSRGVHSVDPTGKAEFDLASKYTQHADTAMSAALPRLAHTLRGLASMYEEDGRRHTGPADRQGLLHVAPEDGDGEA